MNRILEAVKWAPSWPIPSAGNYLNKGPGDKKGLQETCGNANPAGKAMVQAPVVMAVCGNSKKQAFTRARPAPNSGLVHV